MSEVAKRCAEPRDIIAQLFSLHLSLDHDAVSKHRSLVEASPHLGLVFDNIDGGKMQDHAF